MLTNIESLDINILQHVTHTKYSLTLDFHLVYVLKTTLFSTSWEHLKTRWKLLHFSQFNKCYSILWEIRSNLLILTGSNENALKTRRMYNLINKLKDDTMSILIYIFLNNATLIMFSGGETLHYSRYSIFKVWIVVNSKMVM